MVSHEFSIYRLCSEDDTKVLKSHSGMRVVKSSPDRRQQIMTTKKNNKKIHNNHIWTTLNTSQSLYTRNEKNNMIRDVIALTKTKKILKIGHGL